MKFVVTSDLHLGDHKYGKVNPKTGLNLRLEDTLACLDSSIDLAIEKDANWVCTGDIYHKKHPNDRLRREFAKRIARACRKAKVIIIPGNHDQTIMRAGGNTLSELEEISSEFIDNLFIISKPGWVTIDDIAFGCFPHVNRGDYSLLDDDEFFKWQVEQIKKLSKEAKQREEQYKIFLGHFGTNKSETGNSFDLGMGSSSPRIIPLSIVNGDEWDRVYLGDIHFPQVLSERARHVGSICRVDFGEEKEEKGVWYFENGEDEFFPIRDRDFRTISADLQEDPRPTMANFLDEIQEIDLTESIVRTRIKISEKDQGTISLDGLDKYLDDNCWANAGIEKDIISIEVKDSEGYDESMPILDILSKFIDDNTELFPGCKDDYLSAARGIMLR